MSGKKAEDRQILETWRLACLANDSEKQEEAIEYCRSLLLIDPAHFGAITWASARNFEVDLEPSEEALERLVDSGTANVFQVLALASHYLASDRADHAINVLARTKPIFVQRQAEPLWTFWQIQSFVAAGDANAAENLVEDFETRTGSPDARLLTLRATAKKTGNWQQLVEFLERNYAETNDPAFLLECCEVMAKQQNWSYVADRAEQLVSQLNTGETLRLAAIATYNTRRFELCLKMLNEHQHLFKQGKLPSDLRRIRIQCQHALGILLEAISEAEALAHDEPTIEHLLSLGQLYLDKGDLKGLTIVARHLANRPDLSPEQSIRMARLVQWEDQTLAISLWHKAVSQDLPDSLVGEVVTLGFQLGRDDDLRPLLTRLAQLGQQGQGGIQAMAVNQMLEMASQWREHAQTIENAYRSGMIPIHLVAESLNRPLADFYHALLEANEGASDLLRYPMLLARHGGRALMDGFPDNVPQWRLNLDITAILLANHLGILPNVEEVFSPIRIPVDTITTLIFTRDKVTHHQPSILRDHQRVIQLVEQGKLQVSGHRLLPNYEHSRLVEELGEGWVALFESARANQGYLVDFFPLTKIDLSGPPSKLPDDIAKYLVNCRSLVEALWQQGPLSEEEYHKALVELGEEGRTAATEAIPREGHPLYLDSGIAQVLAGADLLSIVCERFRAQIGQREIEQIRAELWWNERRRAVEGWLTDLINRMTKGIDDGKYSIIPIAIDEGDASASHKIAPQNFYLSCLLTLFRFKPEEGDVIWVDDRYMNGYSRRDSVPIVGINEILKALVSAGALSTSDYREKVTQLRASNIRFTPVQADEIVYHLQQARVNNQGVLVETKELSTLRRYVAACLLDGDILQRPPLPEGSPNERGEMDFIVGLSRAILDAIGELWKTSSDDDSTCRSRAEWILGNLYIDHLGLSKMAKLQRSEEEYLFVVGLTLTSLIFHVLKLDPESREGRPSVRHRYLNWLSERIFLRRFEADPSLIAAVAGNLKKYLIDLQQNMPAEAPRAVALRVVQEVYQDLPEPIRNELERDAGFLADIGFRPLIVVSGLHFDPDDFWQAASEAINGREAKAAILDQDKEVIFKPCHDSSGHHIFCFDHPTSNRHESVLRDVGGLLLESSAEREKFLLQNRAWFDCSNEILEQIVAEIVAIENPKQRVEKAMLWRSSSAVTYYMELEQRLSQQGELRFVDLLSLNAEGLLRHLGLTTDAGSGGEFQTALRIAAQRLVKEEGLESAVERLFGLPVPLSTELLGAVVELSSADKKTLIKRLLSTSSAPLAKIHLVYLLLHCDAAQPAFHRLARWFTKSLLSDTGKDDIGAFLAILRWISSEFDRRPDIRMWPAHIRLAMSWAHAHRLYTILLSVGVPIAWLQEKFGEMGQLALPEIFSRDSEYWYDVAHPRQVSVESFILGGMAYSLENKSDELVDEGLRDIFLAKAFHELGGVRLPTPPLLKDVSQAPNAISSFLGGDRGEKLLPLLGEEEANALSHSTLQALVEQAINRLTEANNDLANWALLYALLGDLPPSESLASRLKLILRQTNFISLFESDVRLGGFALQAASLQAIHLGDEEIHQHLRDQIVKAAKLFADLDSVSEESKNARGNDTDDRQEAKSLLLESALNISIAARPSGDVISEFSDLVKQLVEISATMLQTWKPIIQRLCEELPLSQAYQLWPLFIRLRAL
jgi:hypothetical protein